MKNRISFSAINERRIRLKSGVLRRVSRSAAIAVKVAMISFEKAFRENEELDTILGYRDALTDVPNRNAWERDSKRIGDGTALVLIDIDHFKQINDSRGHVFGDIILKRLARILKETAGRSGKIYRIGGDEFALLVPRQEVREICHDVRRRVRREDNFTISQGILLETGNELTPNTIHRTDEALYLSKRKGRDRITVVMPVYREETTRLKAQPVLNAA